MKKNRRLRPFLAAVLLLTALIALMPRGAASDAGEAYIVKYKASAARLLEDDGVPFEVVSEAEMKRLRRMGVLEWYEPDGEAVLLGDSAQWNLDMIGALTVFGRGFAGGDVRVGVLDSGVNPHPDIAPCLTAGHNYITNAPDPEDTSDIFGHGTRVAGLVAGYGEAGQTGVAPGAQLVPLKVTDERSVKVSAVCRAIYGGIDDYGCRVLNLSLGVQTDYAALREAVAYAEARGVVVVSAVGNGGTRMFYYPAAYDTVIGVGAVDSGGAVYSRSNHNESIWLAAPGVDVRSAASSGGYTTSTGTSFSVPQVSGAAAVLLGIDPELRPETVRSLLAQTAADAGPQGYDEYYGHGILDLAAAVETLGDGEAVQRCSFLPETGPAAALRNDTDAPIDCTCLLVCYDEAGLCRSVKTQRLSLPARGTADLEAPDEALPWAQFVYETDTMIPLAGARRSGGFVPAADPAASGPEGSFCEIGEAAGVTVEPRNAAGAVEAVSGAYPGADRLRVILPDTAPWARYVLTVSEAGTDTILYADQRTGSRQTVFDIAFPLPAERTALRISVGSDAEGFSRTDLPLSFVPAEPPVVPSYVNCLRDAACPLTPYSDLDSGAWYHDGVHWAMEEGVMNGVGGGRFTPDGATSRAMLVTMLWRLEDRPEAAAPPTFADVAPGQWYSEAVAWAASERLVEGYSAERFGPGDPITREQLAVILWRYAAWRGENVTEGVEDRLGQFLDAEKAAPWALEALRWAVHTELVRGTGPGRLSPKSGATRAQTATMLMRLLP